MVKVSFSNCPNCGGSRQGSWCPHCEADAGIPPESPYDDNDD